MDFCKYVNVFQGCGEIDLPTPAGIAAKWFFIKAGCGNTLPAATLPFGAMSVSPYSGGYPTGYGDHFPNSFSRPRHFREGKGLLGFSHLHQSGTGAIGYYYNYVIVTPRYSSSTQRRDPEHENASPGYYSCFLEDIKCELTSTKHTAFHRYSFGSAGGYVTLDFLKNGLSYPGSDGENTELVCENITGKTARVKFISQGVEHYFAISSSEELSAAEGTAVINAGESGIVSLKVSLSVRSFEQAEKYLSEADCFDAAAANAREAWQSELSKIRIDGVSDRIKEIFYSNLYHSLVKPADRSGESFVYGGDKAFVVDLSTLWDMYKTELPLIFMINGEMAKKTVETLLSFGEAIGRIPNNIGISDKYKMHSEQARMLGGYVLLTAYRYGVEMDVKRMLRVIKNDIFADDKKDFTVDGVCMSHTWMLDMADCCALTACVAAENGDEELHDILVPLAKQWKKCYNKKTGLLDENSSYYEGTLYNYSFRQMVDMDERIALAGGKERFAELLDEFFGYGAEDVTLPTDPCDSKPVDDGMKLGRFEGFNNESDTEAPFSYIYADRHDRTCEVVRAGMKYMFSTGRGGLPGNNDTGALSSYYVFAALGLFPVAGQDLFLIGSPFVSKAVVELFNGNVLTITAANCSEENIYVESVKFNGMELDGFKVPASELLRGGKLEFVMTGKK